MNKYTTIENNKLKMSFPFKTDNTNCEIEISFHKTLRIPDDNKKYGLPPSLGLFPLEHVEDFSENLPASWKEHGGVFMPMHQSEAMWISFSSKWPFAVKIASGKVNAVSGKPWCNHLENNNLANDLGCNVENESQDYIVVPSQPWLDGFNVSKGVIRQFVAVPLNSGFTVEEQITGDATIGGLQIMVFPMKEEEFKKIDMPKPIRTYKKGLFSESLSCRSMSFCDESSEMGLGAGGFMKQDIYKDKYNFDSWATESQRIFVHLLNSLEYLKVTKKSPPNKPLSPKEYQFHGYPWYDYYSDDIAIKGATNLSKIDSIAELEVKTNHKIYEDNSSINHGLAINLKKINNGKW
jgi:hypothetical protein